ncbi:energy-coupling factor ABC transporter ATP-binding protein [Pseudodesulfovibrio sediminis]|uniref:ABC transporter ATP-binding protein n=1 Tax=Pseudodesulfovibrio sediminis TaxID=2810563 RepID=A0ABN6EMQ1_9BACT|nr:ABC transporter ATP-binding protein [Pseudodesulfovibrio sediminis]BCS86864.1 ABC transporter ATP-binding protein [Pseudodesulfovibrio sediminis]
MATLTLDDVTYAYPGTQSAALNGISARIEHGECVALIGANDAGKSTLCYALTGVVPHLFNGRLSGDILKNDERLSELSVAEIACDVGLVMQIPANQFSNVRFTVFEEVAFSLENRGVEREAIWERVMRVLALTGLTELAERSPQQLSGGQQQRVVLASMLVGEPDVLVLDEPTTFLDPRGTREVFEILDRLRSQGKTIVIAEQKLDMVARYADRVLALHQGKLVLDGPPCEVLVDPMIREIGLDWTRYTQVAALAVEHDRWKAGQALATTFSEVVSGLKVD